jgi:hypothetical protein
MPWDRKLECEALESDPVCRPSRPVSWSRARRTQPSALYGPRPSSATRSVSSASRAAACCSTALGLGAGHVARSLLLSTALGLLALYMHVGRVLFVCLPVLAGAFVCFVCVCRADVTNRVCGESDV